MKKKICHSKSFLNIFQPKLSLKNIYELTPEHLKTLKIKGIIVDFDNTLLSHKKLSFAPALKKWLKIFQEQEIKICIVSNSFSKSKRKIAKSLNMPIIWRAIKPKQKAFKQAMKMFKLCPKETAVIGDQVFTDILGGNRLGLYTILVAPINKHESIGMRIIRYFEKLILRKLAGG